MNRRAYPYRRPHPDAVATGGWFLRQEDGEGVPLPPSIVDWDYQRDLDFECTVEVDLDKVRETAALPVEAELALTVVWNSSGSGLRMLAADRPLQGVGTRSVHLAFTVLGRDSGGVLSIDTQLVLPSRLDNPDPTGPRRAGSVLWHRDAQVRLQGDASQFPMAVVDFGKAGYPEDAPWYLDVGPNLEAATMGAVLLLVNSRTTVVLDAMRKAEKARHAEKLIHSALRQDVVRLLIEHTIANEDLDDDSVFETDALGHMLLGVVRTHLPGMTLASLRSMRRSDPSLLSARVQSAVGLFAKES
ncbi:hypothetical protein P3T37_002182 [Kitasatospora sp. MAA4]|uniref:hypothetical protein n=1 Tax=Kitasatospora sp. MAA4 TaxID=3035093 RepID=UPI00247480EC|nr:hypothetical protein [Kitasatospora sp. MAA4]MDH6132796.1 hypothetical protein [Kitasatospora sp. MAA4]